MQFFDNIQEELISRISLSTKSIKIAVTWFTNHDIFNAILRKLDNAQYKIDLIVLNDRINNKVEGVDFQKLIDLNGNFYYSNVENMVHHKFCIIDDKIVITGSYNWTYYAENRNWENIVVLTDEKVVMAFVQEFDKIKQQHYKVESVVSSRRYFDVLDSNKYLETDYDFQAKNELQKGNDLETAKIYSEILKLDSSNKEIQEARTKIINKINSNRFEVCPFEIGIHYKTTGYKMAIPAFSKLPITVIQEGHSPSDYAKSLEVTVQKYDKYPITMFHFSTHNLKPGLKETQKVEITLNINQDGILKVTCTELSSSKTRYPPLIDLRKWL